jgi:uncharacterized membrane protein
MASKSSGDKISRKLDRLIKKQYEIDKEINKLKSEVYHLTHSEKNLYQTNNEHHTTENQTTGNISIPDTDINIKEEKKIEKYETTPTTSGQESIIADNNGKQKTQDPSKLQGQTYTKKKNLNLERYIGENLINKIGIIILVLGVAIGTKYAISNFNFGVTFRIVAGYLLGSALLGLAVWLKPKYHGFSAVLLSGAMAIFYFISYTAYGFHDIISRNLSFALLLLFTVFTVFAALNYNQQIIAHFGLVGAYITPFLISSDSSAWNTLMIYVLVINIGILIVAIFKYWRALHISSFVSTYIILASWYAFDYEKTDFNILLFYLTIFFILFYSTFLLNKLVNKGKFGIFDIILLSANSFVYYGFGMGLINQLETETNYLGIFSFFNALIHFIAAIIIFRQKQAEKSLFLFIAGLVLLFLTLVFPSQFDGNWVTIFWAGEALILFLVGRIYRLKAYEISSYPLTILSFFSLIHDWIVISTTTQQSAIDSPTPFLNTCFITAVFLVVIYLVILRFDRIRKYRYFEIEALSIRKLFFVITPLITIAASYLAFFIEFDHYWDIKYMLSEKQIYLSTSEISATTIFNNDILHLRRIWIVNFSILFFTILSYLVLNLKTNNKNLITLLIINGLHLPLFLFLSLYELSELRESFLDPKYPEYYQYTNYLNFVRYLCFIFISILLLNIKQIFKKINLEKSMLFDLILAGCLVWILSSELLQWLDIANAENSYKLILSILWGVFALLFVIWGIIKNKTHLRVSAFVLIGIILIKMFFYDLSHMNGFKKSILFIIIGILMLGISFLYNKYKHRLFEGPDKQIS